MKTTEQLQEWLSDASDLLAVGFVIAAIGYTAQATGTAVPRVAWSDTVQLEGLVVTPLRVYSATEWALSRPLPGRVAARGAGVLLSQAECRAAGWV